MCVCVCVCVRARAVPQEFKPNLAAAQVAKDGQAAAAGLRAGCKVFRAGSGPVATPAELEAAVAAAKSRGDSHLELK